MTETESFDSFRGRVLAVARVFLGVLFLATWAENLHKGLYGSEKYAAFVQSYADTTWVPGMSWFIDEIVVPHAGVFGTGQLVVELVVMGVFVAVGLWTPVSGLVAAAFGLNLLLATRGSGEWWGTYGMLVALALVVALTRSGRTWGLDAVLARRRPRPRLPVY
jgi:uncharacterized membrane protein YphA (DoxX/SURF4 family)